MQRLIFSLAGYRLNPTSVGTLASPAAARRLVCPVGPRDTRPPVWRVQTYRDLPFHFSARYRDQEDRLRRAGFAQTLMECEEGLSPHLESSLSVAGFLTRWSRLLPRNAGGIVAACP